MARLIDLDKIKPIDFPSYDMDGMDVVRYLDTFPKVDAVEVVHGRIEEVEIVPNYMWKYRCSCCQSDAERWYKYCPNCGAKMDCDRNDI